MRHSFIRSVAAGAILIAGITSINLSAQTAGPCADLPALQTEWIDLGSQRDTLKKILDNYGFQRTTADFENYQKVAQKALDRKGPPKDGIKEATKDLQKKMVEKAKSTVEEFIKSLQSAKSYNELGPQLEKLHEIAKELGVPDSLRSHMTQMAYDSNAQLRLQFYGTILNRISVVEQMAELAQSEDQAEILRKGIIMAAGQVNPIYGTLAKEIDWAGQNLYDAATGQWTKHQIDQLTKMTEGDLRLLKKTTGDLAKVTRRLAEIKPSLSAKASSCGSPKPTNNSGHSAGKIIGSVAGAGAAGIGTYIALDKLVPKTDPIGSSSSSSTSGSNSGGGTTSSANRFDGTYRGTSTISCTSSGPFNPCASVVPTASCAPSSFTFPVRNGVVSDPCQWFVKASISSSGFFSGTFTGAYADVALSGTLSSSGSATMSGSGVGTGNTYRVTVTITKQ